MSVPKSLSQSHAVNTLVDLCLMFDCQTCLAIKHPPPEYPTISHFIGPAHTLRISGFISCRPSCFKGNTNNWALKSSVPLRKQNAEPFGSFCFLICWSCSAAAAKSLQSCPTLCDPIDDSPPGSPVPGILQARTLEWVAISFSKHESGKWKGSRSVMSNS